MEKENKIRKSLEISRELDKRVKQYMIDNNMKFYKFGEMAFKKMLEENK